MEDHPVPQNITAYQFRLVGSMTLKQFLELAGGIIMAWILISSKLNALIKWPLGIFAALFGVGLAFFPIEERPLDQWLINFIRAIYSPTQFVWRPSRPAVKFLQTKKTSVKNLPPITKTSKTNPDLDNYLKTLPGADSDSPLDQAESGYLSRVQALFATVKVKQENIVIKQININRPKQEAKITGIKVRRLKSFKAIDVPVAQAVKIAPADKPAAKPTVPATPTAPAPQPTKQAPVIKTKPIRSKGKVVPAKLAPQLPLPYKPKDPNMIVGMVFDAQDHILTNTIIEIKDSDGNPVRALKTNRLGQFSIATPLKNGIYLIEAEHAEKHFDIIELNVEGKVIPPIEIRSYD